MKRSTPSTYNCPRDLGYWFLRAVNRQQMSWPAVEVAVTQNINDSAQLLPAVDRVEM